MLCVEGLHIRVGDFSICDASFTVDDGAYFVLLGVSGAGKTVLLDALAGLVPVAGGRILWNGEDITYARIQSRGMGLVYQDQALFPHMTVRQNIAYGIRKRRENKTTVSDGVHALADEVGVTDLLDRFPETLSGGEAQRVALARALSIQPRCLLLDEPLSALDSHARSGLRALLRGLHRKGKTIVHVTHDYEEAVSLASHVGIMEKGTLAQTGTPTQVFHHPMSEFVARFVGIRNVFFGRLDACHATNPGVAPFVSGNVHFGILTDARPGRGLMILRSEDVTISRARPESSAQNCFSGRVVDIVPARLGLDVCVDIGVEISALVTPASAEKLELCAGRDVWVSFKASAARFIEE